MEQPTESQSETQLTQRIKQKADEIKKYISPLSSEKWEKSKHAISTVARCIPEATLVGGFALRLHLSKRGLPIPQMPALDIDFAIKRDDYDRVRQALQFPEESVPTISESLSPERTTQIQENLRRKGDKEPVPEIMGGGYRNFFEDPDNEMALEDNKYKQHIDLFVTEENQATEEIPVNGATVKVLTPEELFIKRLNQINKIIANAQEKKLEVIELPRKTYQYFYLNGEIIDSDKMTSQNGHNWTENVMACMNTLEEGLKEGKIKLVDVYHP